MTVALIAHYVGPRLGIGQYLNRLLPALADELQKRDVAFRILASPNAIKNTPALEGLQEYTLEVPQLDFPPIKRLIWVATSFSGFCKQQGITSVAWLSNPLVMPWHPDSTAVLHDVNEWKNNNKGRLRTYLRSIFYLNSSLDYAKLIITASQATTNDLVHFRPKMRNSSRLNTIVNGSDSGLSMMPRCNVPAPSKPFVLSVGRIDPVGKKLPQAAEFVKQLREKTSVDWELHLVGGMNKFTEEEGKRFVQELSELSWGHYHGHVSDEELAEWYRQCSAVIFLSNDEGFGLPIAEAVSFKKHTIISSANKAGLEAGGKGVIPIDIDALAEGALHFIDAAQKAPANTETQMPTWQAAAEGYAEKLCSIETVHG